MLENFRAWWHRVDSKLRERPLNTILWFLLCHCSIATMIAVSACAIAVILNMRDYLTILLIVAGIHVLAFILQICCFTWLYPRNGHSNRHRDKRPPSPPSPPSPFRPRNDNRTS